MSRSVTNQRTAEETLAGIVGHIVAQEGVTEQAARERVLKDCPDLRAKLCAEANAGRPSRDVQNREDLRERATAYNAMPRFGGPVE